METYNRFPISIKRGKGCWVWDTDGKKYLDAVAGIAACTLGHSNKALQKSLSKQLKKVQHISNLYRIPEQEELANWLISNSCADKVFFCNSGAEANEAAIKLARKFANKNRSNNLSVILSAKNSFHGRTVAALSATGQSNYHKGFEPLFKGFEFFSYNDLNSLISLVEKIQKEGSSISAVIIEPLQGEGGIHPGDPIFFKVLREICDKNNILLIFDEVQTGMGRLGDLWGYKRLGVEPDAFTIAKGLGGGHPIGALLVKEKFNLFQPGDHASTFGGNPFSCMAAITVAKEIERRNILSHVSSRGKQLQAGLGELVLKFPEHLKTSRGVGLIQGLVIHEKSNLTAAMFTNCAIKENLLVVPAGKKVIRMVPPLNIKESEVKELLIRISNTFYNL